MASTKTAKELGVSPPYSRHAMAYVLAGGRGSRLLELTDRRAKPAVYFGGVYAERRPSHGFPASATLTLPPLATVYLAFRPPGVQGAAP